MLKVQGKREVRKDAVPITVLRHPVCMFRCI